MNPSIIGVGVRDQEKSDYYVPGLSFDDHTDPDDMTQTDTEPFKVEGKNLEKGGTDSFALPRKLERMGDRS